VTRYISALLNNLEDATDFHVAEKSAPEPSGSEEISSAPAGNSLQLSAVWTAGESCLEWPAWPA
jgi:hypothetical protein